MTKLNARRTVRSHVSGVEVFSGKWEQQKQFRLQIMYSKTLLKGETISDACSIS